MKRLRIAAVVFFLTAALWSQQIELPILGRASLNIFSAMTFYPYEGDVLTDGVFHMRNRLVRIDLERARISEYFEIHRFLGTVEDRLLVSTVDREHKLKLRFVDPSSLATSEGPDWKVPLDWAILRGPEGTLFSARLDDRGIYTPYRFHPQDQSRLWLSVQGVPTSITHDSLHLMIHNPDSGEIFVWSIAEKVVRSRLRTSDPAGQTRFLTNGLFLLPPQYAGQERWRLYNLQGVELAEVILRIPGVDPLFLWFTPDLRRAVVCARGEVNPETAVVNSEGFRRWLEREGYLFNPGTGVLNDSRVRVRAYPILDAEVLGHLERGDRVEVLERSGLRENIGAMNDYWYRTRRADGLEGWSYGAFIDLQ